MQSKRPTIGIGILSWKGYDSLKATLQSYRDAGLFGLFDEQLLFLPEMEERGVAIARKFGVPYKGHPQNLGILGGHKALVEATASDYILLLENDYKLIESLSEAKAQLDRAVRALTDGVADIWRFRHRCKPGDVWYIWREVLAACWRLRRLKNHGCVNRLIRPGKAKRKIDNAVFFMMMPTAASPNM